MRISPTLALAFVALLSGCGSSGSVEGGPSVEGELARTDGPSLHWRTLGHGPDTVVVIHGGVALHHRYLVDPLESLLRGRTLVFYDFRGRGRSAPVDSADLSFDADVADVDAIRRHFRLERVTLIGHHYGAAVAALYAARHPERVTRMVLLSPFPVHNSLMVDLTYMPGDSAGYSAALANVIRLYDPATSAATCQTSWLLLFGPWRTDTLTPYRAMAPAICDASPERLADADRIRRVVSRGLGNWAWREELRPLAVPALVIEGRGEPRVEVASTRWAQHLGDARILLLEPPYLFPWIGEPTRFRSAVGEFLRGDWPAGATKPAEWTP